jgi:hypothetical protein
MKINGLAAGVLAVSILVSVSYVLFLLQHDPPAQVASRPKPTEVAPAYFPSPAQVASRPEPAEAAHAQLPPPKKVALPSHDPLVQHRPEAVEKASPNADSFEIITREKLAEASEVVDDDVEIPSSIEVVEGELTDIFFDADLTDEEVDSIFAVMRAGTEEDLDAFEPSNDYPARVTFILRLLKQTEMNAAEIIAMVHDIFPHRENTSE